MRNKLKEKFRNCLSMEIAIDYKTCTYFFCILLYYCIYLICQEIYSARILCMFEMVAAAYFISYLQVYGFHNFDEAQRFGKKEMPGVVFCICLYTAVSYLFAWFDQNVLVTFLFSAYMLFIYYVIYVANKIKRAIDTENLNRMLTEFKKGK